MKTQVYNFPSGQAAGDIDLAENIFSRKWNSDLVHQALVAQQVNRLVAVAHAKGRGEVRGGGKKPWRQKGTGRARHGSIRSPIWKGGGVSHGPVKEKRYDQKINKKMKRAALFGVLSKKLSERDLKIVDSLQLKSFKTKELAAALIKFFGQPKNSKKLSALLVPAADNKLIFRATSNIPKVKSLRISDLNIEDLLKYKNVIIDRDAIGEMAKR